MKTKDRIYERWTMEENEVPLFPTMRKLEEYLTVKGGYLGSEMHHYYMGLVIESALWSGRPGENVFSLDVDQEEHLISMDLVKAYLRDAAASGQKLWISDSEDGIGLSGKAKIDELLGYTETTECCCCVSCFGPCDLADAIMEFDLEHGLRDCEEAVMFATIYARYSDREICMSIRRPETVYG